MSSPTVSTLPTDTLFALASAPGRAGVAVVRLSGPRAGVALAALIAPTALPAPRVATLHTLVDPVTKALVDKALILRFPAPQSFTGEDVVEIHVHGGRAVLAALTEALRAEGLRVAEPGEFTRRAFMNGKLDLTEAEAIADLVDAETAAQHRQALRQMEGALGKRANGWAERLTQALARLEAALDFAEEEGVPTGLEQFAQEESRALHAEMSVHLADHHRGERLREGFVVALIGPPNAGKSSLLNALARREAAIVAPTPGTTRDVIEASLDLDGYPVTFADTAGLCPSEDPVESEGVRRALAKAQNADLKVLVFDGTLGPDRDPATLALRDESSLVVLNKVDLVGQPLPSPVPHGALWISATTGFGLPELTRRIVDILDMRYGMTGASVLTRARHRAALEECCTHLGRLQETRPPELMAEDLRLALRALGRLTGRVDAEAILDVIFREFCVGK